METIKTIIMGLKQYFLRVLPELTEEIKSFLSAMIALFGFLVMFLFPFGPYLYLLFYFIRFCYENGKRIKKNEPPKKSFKEYFMADKNNFEIFSFFSTMNGMIWLSCIIMSFFK